MVAMGLTKCFLFMYKGPENKFHTWSVKLVKKPMTGEIIDSVKPAVVILDGYIVKLPSIYLCLYP